MIVPDGCSEDRMACSSTRVALIITLEYYLLGIFVELLKFMLIFFGEIKCPMCLLPIDILLSIDP